MNPPLCSEDPGSRSQMGCWVDLGQGDVVIIWEAECAGQKGLVSRGLGLLADPEPRVVESPSDPKAYNSLGCPEWQCTCNQGSPPTSF